MKDAVNVKERIIEVTTELIDQYNGNTKNITARLIAEGAGIGLGLINYHFGSKDNLIVICVQRKISKVVACGVGMHKEYATDQEFLAATATYVFDFLFENAAVSRISILGDMQDYSVNSNSVHTQKGFLNALTRDVDEDKKSLLSFMLTAIIQVAFLGSATVKELFGYDLAISAERAGFIQKIVSILFNEVRMPLESSFQTHSGKEQNGE